MEAIIQSICGYDPTINTESTEHIKEYFHTYIVNGACVTSGTYRVDVCVEQGDRITLLVNNHNPATILPNCKIYIRFADYGEGDNPCFWLNGIINLEEMEKEDLNEKQELYNEIKGLFALSDKKLPMGEAILLFLKEHNYLEPNEVYYALFPELEKRAMN